MDRASQEVFCGATCPTIRKTKISVYQHGGKCLALVQLFMYWKKKTKQKSWSVFTAALIKSYGGTGRGNVY